MAEPRLSDVELAAAKRYMRPDADDDDDGVIDCVLAARAYLAGAGVSLPMPESPRRALYDIVCHALALGSYDLRDPTVVGSAVNENIQLSRKLTQLKSTEPGG